MKLCGVLVYADDLTLISPSVRGVHSLIDKCDLFVVEYDPVFNEKNVCVKFGNN